MTLMPEQHKLNIQQRAEARRLMGEGKTLRQVAAHFGVSRMAIWRLMNPNNPDKNGGDD
jgi:transposase